MSTCVEILAVAEEGLFRDLLTTGGTEEHGGVTTGDTGEHGGIATEEHGEGGFLELSDVGCIREEREREREVYRGRTIAMLKKYMRYSLQTGRVPSLVGREFFRSTVTKYRVVTFEDRVIFVHDMETCLGRLDEFSRQVLARVILQEYEHEEAARIFGCTRMTVHRKLIEALDKLVDILRAADLLSPISAGAEKSCQEGEEDDFFISD